MPEFIDPTYQVYAPAGVVDAIDGNTSKKGAMLALKNLIPQPETMGVFVPRSAAYEALDFTGFTTPGYVSLQHAIGTLVVGFLSTGLHAGFDQPFVYDSETGTYLTITGITGANVPTSPATSGDWNPPTVDQIGSYIVFTHPGFNGAGNGYFGWLDFTGASITSLTGDTNSVTNPTIITNLSANPLTTGVTVGMTISGTNIPASTTVIYVGSTFVVMSAAATGTTPTVALTFAGGTTTSPLWNSGNTNTNALPGVPVAVSQYRDRAYFSVDNALWFTSVLNPLNITNATDFLTLGSADPIVGTVGQPFFTTQSGGILAALLAFKSSQIWQVTGDSATSNLSLNQLSDGVGTMSARSLANTPLGTVFVAPDGIRAVNLEGQVSPPNSDLKTPFLNPNVPSRISGAYNMGFYRICTSYLLGGVTQNVEYWLDTVRNLWVGPHTLTYDCITAFASSFLVSGPDYTGSILQSNVIPNIQTDFYVELGATLTFDYQTVLVPEVRPNTQVSIPEASLFLGYDQQQLLTCNVLDQAKNVLATVGFTTQFLAPANATNWLLAFQATNMSATVVVPSRHSFQITGTCTSNLALGSLSIHYQYQAQNNALAIAAYDGSDLDFGSVTDPILHVVMDWGSVSDPILGTVDFETSGTHTGPP